MSLAIYDLNKVRSTAQDTARDEQNPFRFLSYNDAWIENRTEESWVVKDLELGAGRPNGIWGYGSSGKSYVAILIVLCAATGRPLFDRFEVRYGKAAYLSHEMGTKTCIERFRRLANGLGCDPKEFAVAGEEDPNPMIGIYPSVKMNDPSAADIYCRQFEKFDLVVVDSLRRALPGEDENDSGIARHLDMLALASEKTGTTYLYLHHTGKEDIRNDAEGKSSDKRASGRGSSAIFDGSGSVWRIQGQCDEIRVLSQIRPHEDGDGISRQIKLELLTVESDGIFDTRKPALRYKMIQEQVKVSAFDRVKAEVMHTVSSLPGINSNAIEARVQGKSASKRQALLELEEEKKIVSRDGPRNSRLYYPA